MCKASLIVLAFLCLTHSQDTLFLQGDILRFKESTMKYDDFSGDSREIAMLVIRVTDDTRFYMLYDVLSSFSNLHEFRLLFDDAGYSFSRLSTKYKVNSYLRHTLIISDSMIIATALGKTVATWPNESLQSGKIGENLVKTKEINQTRADCDELTIAIDSTVTCSNLKWVCSATFGKEFNKVALAILKDQKDTGADAITCHFGKCCSTMEPEVTGERSKESIKEFFNGKVYSKLRHAYNSRLRENKSLHGCMRVKFTIRADGKIDSCPIVECNLNDEILEKQTVDIISGLDAEPVDGIGETVVRYSLYFGS